LPTTLVKRSARRYPERTSCAHRNAASRPDPGKHRAVTDAALARRAIPGIAKDREQAIFPSRKTPEEMLFAAIGKPLVSLPQQKTVAKRLAEPLRKIQQHQAGVVACEYAGEQIISVPALENSTGSFSAMRQIV